jgi:hypothetical protein
MKATLVGSTVVVLVLAAGCSSDSNNVNLRDGTGAEGGDPSTTGGTDSDTGGATGDSGGSAQLGGASLGGSSSGGARASGGSESGGSGNASTGGRSGGMGGTGGAPAGGFVTGGFMTGGFTTGGFTTGGFMTGGFPTGGGGAVLTGGTGGIICEPPCIEICQGGICDCACPDTGGMGGATGGAETGGAVTGGGPTGGGPAGGAGGAPGTCGGVVCGPDEECCGPSECGHCILASTDPACASSCTRRRCGDEGLECLDPVLGYPGEICVERRETAGPTVVLGYECVRNPCGAEPLACDCAMPVCEEGAVFDPQCVSADPDTLTLVCDDFGGVCNSPDTPIATPRGERAIATLREGDLVYSVHDGAIVAVPLVRATRTSVFQHRVVRLELDSGVVLEISALHPTADGRSIGALRVADTLDGAQVVSVERVPYRFDHTYDILPASDTGTYFAGGVRLGSTLAAAR